MSSSIFTIFERSLFFCRRSHTSGSNVLVVQINRGTVNLELLELCVLFYSKTSSLLPILFFLSLGANRFRDIPSGAFMYLNGSLCDVVNGGCWREIGVLG